MDPRDISPDQVVLWEWDGIALNLTIANTWLVMGLLCAGAYAATRRLSSGTHISKPQAIWELLVGGIEHQIRDIAQQEPREFVPFVGTLFVFIATSNVLGVVPGFVPPTGSLSTTLALAICVFVAVPYYGITKSGARAYFRQYCRPSPFLLPFNVIGELSRTLALAVRLFGNMMSGAKLIAILLAIVPFFVSIPIMALGLLTGLIQAYIFALLAMVYIASAMHEHASEIATTSNHPQGKEASDGQ